MILAVEAVAYSLRRILDARGDNTVPSIDKDCSENKDLLGVFIVGPAAIGLLLGGQRTVEMVMVSMAIPSSESVSEVAEELEELLKVREIL